MKSKQAKRTGTTRHGEEVELNTMWKVDGGHEGYILNSKGVAVLIFIPDRGVEDGESF